MEQEFQGVFGFPAQVRRIEPALVAELTQKARDSHAFDPSVFDHFPPFFWAAEISNNRLDAHFTHMERSSLDNFARATLAGVSFQNSHRWNELPIGRSLTGKVVESEDGFVRVVSDFFTVEGLKLNGVKTDDFIIGVRTGIIHDVSVGFYGGRHTCDICGQNYFSWKCDHYAGMTYEDEENGVVRQRQATVAIADAQLAEVSAAYDGSTPGAAITKAQEAASEGRLRPEAAQQLERMYRTAIPVTRRFAGVDTGSDESEQEPSQEVRAMGWEAILDKHKIGEGLEGDARVTALDSRLAELLAVEGKLATAQSELAAAQACIKELEPQAVDGRQYRTDLLADALAEGVRAFGSDFDKATYEETLRDASLSVIKRMRDDWKKVGDSRFAGGRQTADEGDSADSNNRKTAAVSVPNEAYG